jgi:uncharacterized membrane protein
VSKEKIAVVETPASTSVNLSSIQIDANTAKLLSAVSYLFPLIGVVLFFLFKKGENDLARFHSLQSIFLGLIFYVIFFIGGFVSLIVITLLGIIPVIGAIVGMLIGFGVLFLSMGIGLVYFLVAVFCLIKVLKGEKYKLPLLGKIAEKYC